MKAPEFKWKNILMGFLTPLFLVGCAHPDTHKQWRCTATDNQMRHWVQYSPTRMEATTLVRDRCREGRYRNTCLIHCLPPKTRWHCVAKDREGHTWYWNSVKRETAIKNARHTCLRHSTVGGCKVPVGNCSKT